jgi:MoaA/NifB/PqqE/SkfB family radical SAM enzyme
MDDLSFVWLEVTGKCQLSCVHCYAESGPSGTHGKMGTVDWLRVINKGVALGLNAVQFIGGEPTLHPDLMTLVRHAVDCGLRVEIFSNLVHVRPVLWEMFSLPGVSLATSYYSDESGQHDAITGWRGSHAKTRANIAEVVKRAIPLRVGIIDLEYSQRWQQAVAELEELGVTAIGWDRLRQVGRGVREGRPDIAQLCGSCANGVAAISPTGEVWPCVFARWMPSGNVLERSLAEIVDDDLRASRYRLMARLEEYLQVQEGGPRCGPNCERLIVARGARRWCRSVALKNARRRGSSARRTTPARIGGASRENSRAGRCSATRLGRELQASKNFSGRPRKDRHSATICNSSHLRSAMPESVSSRI